MNQAHWRRLAVAFLGFIFSLIVAPSAQAHFANETYIYLQVETDKLTGRFEAPVSDIGRVFSLDADGDGETTDAELEAGLSRVNAALEQSLSFIIADQNASIVMTDRGVRDVGIGPYALLNFDVIYSGPIPDTITARFNGLMAKDLPGHRVLMLLESNTKTGLEENEALVSLIFDAEPAEKELKLTGLSGFATFTTFVKHGFHHILIGFDHIAFLTALLLPSVLIARGGKWVAIDSFRSGFFNILSIVTVFTVAHSLTLTLAATGIVSLPSRPIEILIALSIVAAAVVNLTVVGNRYMLGVMFTLGLLHGLGFANVMLPLGVARSTLVQSLLGFNIGVELGQMLIVAIVFPVLLLLSRSKHYVRAVLHGGSMVLILVAVYWFAERAFVVFEKLLG